jgi:enamine deaminase RidA (YjgF/YER057c/UK114 family)
MTPIKSVTFASFAVDPGVAGQTASDHDGKVVGIGDPKAQTRFILGKIQRAVEAAGTRNDAVCGQIPL